MGSWFWTALIVGHPPYEYTSRVNMCMENMYGLYRNWEDILYKQVINYSLYRLTV